MFVTNAPDGTMPVIDGRLFTANGLSDDVSVIDTAAGRVAATVRAGQAPWGVTTWREPAARRTR